MRAPHLERGAKRGRWSEEDARAAAERLEPAPELEALAPCRLVIEAAPERLELKQFYRCTCEMRDEHATRVD